MENNRKPEVIHIVKDIDAKAIEKRYYEDLVNSDQQQFMGITDAKEFMSMYHLEPVINQTYLFDKSSQEYLLLDDSIAKNSSEAMLNSYFTAFHFLGATFVKGKITEGESKERVDVANGGVAYKTFEICADTKKKSIKGYSNDISVERYYGKKVVKSYDEIKSYLVERGLMHDTKLRSRLEELKNSPDQQLTGNYKNKISLTYNLDASLDIAFKASVTPFFEGNVQLKTSCKTQTEIYFELFVDFDERI